MKFKKIKDMVYLDYRRCLVLLILFGIATHLIWFKPGSILFHADWFHWTDAAAGQAWRALGTWNDFFGFGSPRIQIGFTLVQALWSAVAFFGGSFDTGVKLTLLMPIAILGFVTPYLAMRKLIGQDTPAFVAALFYGTTAYFLLRQGSHLPIAIVYAITPLIFMTYTTAIETMKTKKWLVFLLLYSLGLCYEIRIMYIVTFILALYTAFFFYTVRERKGLATYAYIGGLAGVVLLGLNSFWLLPTYFGGTGSAMAQNTSRELFGNYLFDLSHAFAISPAGWSGGQPDETFTLLPVLPYLWFIPLIAFLPLALKVKLSARHRRQFIFFITIALIGIFLTKQVMPPFSWVYPWLYANFPGFALFREASKFYLLTAWGYMGLLALGIAGLRSTNRWLQRTAIAIPVLVACINVVPLITGEVGNMFVSRRMPEDYAILNKQIAEQKDIARALWVPSDPKWAYFDETHPRVSGAAAVQEWKAFQEPDGSAIRQQLKTFFDQPFANDILDASSIRFVIVPLRDTANQDDFIKYFGDDRQFYIDFLDDVSWLKKIDIGTKDAVVYENQRYNSHISATSGLNTLSSLTDMARLYEFNQQELKQPFNVTLKDDDKPIQGTRLESIFSNPDDIDTEQQGLTVPFRTTSKQASLYVNTNSPIVTYKVTNRTLDFTVSRNNQFQLNSQSAGQGDRIDAAGSSQLDPGRQYYVAIDSKIIPVNADGEERYLGPIAKPVRLLSTPKDNLVANADFEQGPWQDEVEDCNAYDEDALVEMEVSEFDHSQGQKTLALYAGNHTACTGPDPVPVTAGGEYLLNFDYRIEDGDEVGYRITFNDPENTVIEQYPLVKDRSWHAAYRNFTVPEGASQATIKLLGIPNTRNRDFTATYYKNLGVRQISTDLRPAIDTEPAYTKVPLGQGKHSFTYTDPAYTGKNLVPNPSLENGLWKKDVGDCNTYDDNPRLKMDESTQASDGKRSLELAAQRHIACTGPEPIPVKENTTYLLSFDHQSPNAKNASYHINFDSPAKGNASINADIPTTEKWQQYSRIIKTPTGAQNLKLSLRARANEREGAYFINRYDNFKLVEIPDIQNQFFVVDPPAKKSGQPKQTSYTHINPTKKLAHIKSASGPFYLALSESYHPNWRLALNNSKVGWLPWSRPDTVASDNHIKWNNFLNGWYVDPEELCKQNRAGCTKNDNGSYNLELVAEFTSQRWYYFGVIISGLTFAIIAVYLGYTSLRDNKRWRLR